MKRRMDMLGLTMEKLSEKSLVSKDIISELSKGTIEWKDIHEVDQAFLCQALLCHPEYFTNSNVRKKDILEKSKDLSNIRNNIIAAKMQFLALDYIKLKNIDL